MLGPHWGHDILRRCVNPLLKYFKYDIGRKVALDSYQRPYHCHLCHVTDDHFRHPVHCYNVKKYRLTKKEYQYDILITVYRFSSATMSPLNWPWIEPGPLPKTTNVSFWSE
jgi:hypothetical protein